jgi:ribosomal protein S20
MAQGAAVKHKKKTKSVLKNIRQSAHRAAVNRMNRTRVRTSIRRMRAALATGVFRFGQGHSQEDAL